MSATLVLSFLVQWTDFGQSDNFEKSGKMQCYILSFIDMCINPYKGISWYIGAPPDHLYFKKYQLTKLLVLNKTKHLLDLILITKKCHVVQVHRRFSFASTSKDLNYSTYICTKSGTINPNKELHHLFYQKDVASF